jgi:putative chitinase
MLLKIGSKGEDVKKLQSKLGLSPDGVFGPGTEAKVKEWQKANGLGTDGIVGPGTWNKMFVTLAPVSESVKSQTTTGSQSSLALKLDKLKGHVPDSVIAEIPDTAAKFGITTPLRLAHLLAQASHESGHFKSVTENLNYSADGLKKIFPKYFPGNLNESYARNPQKIANKVYSSRMGNGDEASGDGFRYRGRGFLQTTGKSNYAEFNKIVDDDVIANPDLVATKYALASAAFFFQKNNLWSICDKGASDEIVTLVSKRVNGGTIGISERLSEFKKFYALLS